MIRLLQSFFLYLAAASDRELAQQVQYLRVENEILCGKLPKRIDITPRERERLLKFGKKVGAALRHLIGIVSYQTFQCWLKSEKESKKPKPTAGRPRKPEELRELILKMAGETGWGYSRIFGELRKLGIRNVSRSTVVNILKENGIDSGPKRGEGTWSDFIQRHAQSLWACDFFTKKVWTLAGLVQFFVLFFIHIGTRRVHIAGMTAHPDNAWMVQQAQNISKVFGKQPVPAQYLILDRDTKFTSDFATVLESNGVELIRTAPRSPTMNAHAERWVLSIKSECLDHFIVFGQDHLQYLCDQYLTYYNQERPHQSLDNQPLPEATGEASATLAFPSGQVVCEERLGGLLKHYHRAA